VLRLNRPSRMQTVPLSPLSGANLATDRPRLSFVLSIRVTDEIALARTRAWRLNPGAASSSGPSEPAGHVRWQRIEASARSRTRWRWPIEFLYPTRTVGPSPPPLLPGRDPLAIGFHVVIQGPPLKTIVAKSTVLVLGTSSTSRA